MIVSDVMNRVKRQFGDESSTQVTDTDIFRWINDAQKEIVVANELLQTKATYDVVAGVSDYTFPTNMLRLQTIRLNKVTLDRFSMQDADEYIRDRSGNETDTPQIYWVWGGNVTLYPTPSLDLGSGLAVYYNRLPTEVTASGDSLDVPLAYHNLIVQYCLLQAYELDEDWTAVGSKQAQFNASLNSLKGEDSQIPRAIYPMITVLEDDR